MKGYFDRIEEGKFAVILVEEMKKEFLYPVSNLPKESVPGHIFELTIENEAITAIQLNSELTEQAVQKTDGLMAKLRSKNKGSKFKK